MIKKETITIASSGTTSSSFHEPGYRLVGLLLPAVDSTVINFDVAIDNSTWLAVKTNTHGAAPATLNLGTADTGS